MGQVAASADYLWRDTRYWEGGDRPGVRALGSPTFLIDTTSHSVTETCREYEKR
jgi:hypothetical protein